jgi:hypothetical protein
MANYSIDYQLDAGYIQRSGVFRVFGVQIVQGFNSQYGGEIFQTTREFDRPYLPQILQNLLRDRACCSLPTNTERHARAYFQDDSYLFICCPFRGGTTEHLLFYRQLTENSKIRLVEAHGETLGRAETINFTRV